MNLELKRKPNKQNSLYTANEGKGRFVSILALYGYDKATSKKAQGKYFWCRAAIK